MDLEYVDDTLHIYMVVLMQYNKQEQIFKHKKCWL